MDFSGFMKNNPQLMGQAMGALGGGQQPAQAAPADAGPGVEPVRQPKDTGEHGYEGLMSVAKLVASFWTGGAAGLAQNAVSTAASGGGGGGSSGTGQAAASAIGGFGGGGGGGNYSQAAQQAGASDWLQKFSGGYGG
jgi:hypothetical protein